MISQCDMLETVRRGAIATLILIASFASQAAAQSADTAQTAIRAALTKWAADFNARDRQAVCGLFSPDLLYDFRGHPERNYKDICNLLQHSLADPKKRYTYSLIIKEILVSEDLAVVRLIWTLKVTRNDTPGEDISKEPGMDVFRKQPDGTWKIIRYIAYEVSS